MDVSPSPRKRRLQLRFSERRLLLMAGDSLAVITAVFIALRIWAFVADEPFTLDFILPQSAWFVALTVLWFMLASANDFYELAVAAQRVNSLQRLTLITLQMLVVYLLVFFLSPRDALPRLFIIYFGVAAFVLIGLWRMLNPALIGWASAPRRALVVGTDWAADTIIRTLAREPSYQVLGVIGHAEAIGTSIASVPVIGDARHVMDIVMHNDISELIITTSGELSGSLFQSVMDAYEYGVTIVPMPLVYERITERVPVEHVEDSWAVVLPISGTSVFNPYSLLKRLFDVALALIGLVILVLLLPPLIVLIYLDSPGPIVYRQLRVGQNGRIFRIIKFRTMIPDAERHTGPTFAEPDDPRMTRFGRIARRLRLDELPQVINILAGDMSWIGPRPERPEHVARLQQKIPFYRTRHVIRPGLTGWAQVRYHYGASDEDALIKLQYDLFYIRHQSLLLDANIIIRTIGKVLRMTGR